MYGLDSIRRFQEGGFTDAQVAEYFANNPGLTESQIAEAMRQTGVSPAQVARVTGADPGYVAQRYDQYLDLVDQATVRQPVTAVSPRLNLVNTLPDAGLTPSGNVSGTGAGVVSSGPPVGLLQNPAVQSPIALTPAGIAALAPSANVSSPINVSSPSPPAVDFVDQQAEGLLNQYYAAIDAGDIRTARNLLSQAQNIYGPETLTNVAQDMLSRLNQSMTQAKTTGDFTGAAKLVEAADEIYGGDALQNIADYLNTDLQLLDANKGVRFTPQNLVQFIQQGKGDADVPVDAGVSTGGGEAGTPEGGVSSILPTLPQGQIYGMPRFERQEFTPLTFAPLRRGATQLRPAMFMPGLTSGQAPLGGSGFTPEQLQQASTRITQEGEAAGKTPEQIQADFAYMMDVGGVSPAELAAATARAPGEIQGLYNLSRPGGLFGTAPTTPFALPQDFALQTGAYGAPTPTFITSGSTAAGNTTAEPTGATKLSQLLDNVQRLAQDVSSLQNPAQYEGAKAGGIIKMAEGGETMPKLSASEAGSKFDMSQFVDEQGRLVSGYSRPVYKDNVIVGYDYQPYQRDVVFNPRLAEAEARGMSDEEREAARRGLIVRQGLTGVDPYAGGLAGIRAREALMRSRPQYYSYAEGGLADVAQNLADRGRKGDSMLVHMAPEEVAGLRALARAQGTDLTINPRTGLPEAFSLKKLFKAASFVLPFVPIPGLFGMSSLLTRSILSGVAAGASAKGGFDLKQALGGGLKAYALGSLGEKLGGGPAAGQGTAPTTAVTAPEAATVDVMGGGAPTITTPSGDVSLASSFTGAGGTPIGPQSLSADLTAPLKVGSGYTDVAAAPIYNAPIGPGGGPDIPVTGGSLPPGADTVPGRMASVVTPEGQGFGQPLTKGTEIAMAGLGGLSIEEGAKEARRYELEAAAARREDEERQRRFEELARRTLGNVRTAKAGGSVNLAKGGMTYMEAGGTTDVTGEPRVVRGTGDGMSDSVPATIEGVQEARLANDEFVIPADVVSDIGNGSSDAGAKKLYDMMDRIRKARHGTTKQPPEIKAERLMPA